MRSQPWFFGVMAAGVAALVVTAVNTSAVHTSGAMLPDKGLTPGKADTVSLAVICHTSTSTRRNVSEATKVKVFAEYHITTRVGYEVDHLIPLAIGGSNSILNLWPEPATPVPGFHQKDVLEVKLHALVCSGKLDVVKAQNQVATDWSAAYTQYVK